MARRVLTEIIRIIGAILVREKHKLDRRNDLFGLRFEGNIDSTG